MKKIIFMFITFILIIPNAKAYNLIGDWSGMLVDYPNYKQEQSYYCGPATIKQAIQYINGTSSSQTTYATSMGTTSASGTNVSKMVAELNKRQTKHKYVSKLITSANKDFVYEYVRVNTVKNYPTIFHALTKSLYRYNGNNIRHYFTVIGYFYSTTEATRFQYVDTYSGNYGRGTTLGTYLENADNVVKTLYANGENRYFIY